MNMTAADQTESGDQSVNTVGQFMATGVQTLTADHTLADALETMEKYGCYHMPVVNSANELQGLVSHRDVLRAMPSSLLPDAEGIDPGSVLVHHFMQRDLITIEPDTELKQAAMFIRNARIGCLPVVQNKQLLGIITDTDFISIAVELMDRTGPIDPIAL